MTQVENTVFRVLEIILVLLLAGMVVMVFGNVVLRYLFNSGIDVSEELSRIFFVWLTFTSAIVVMREQGHLGIDTLTGRLGRGGRVKCMVLVDLVTLFLCWVLFDGTLRQHDINVGTTTPVTGISMGWVYSIMYVTAIGIAWITASRLFRAATGRLTEAEIRHFAGDYGDDPNAAKGYVE